MIVALQVRRPVTASLTFFTESTIPADDCPTQSPKAWRNGPSRSSSSTLTWIPNLKLTTQKVRSFWSDCRPDYSDAITTGIYLDYRYYQQNNLTPRYGFGYGLSYTSFNYTNFQAHRLSDQSNERRWNSGEAFAAANATNQVGSSLAKA